MKYLTDDELKKLNNYQRQRYINYVKNHMTYKNKMDIIKYAASSEEGMKELLTQVYNVFSKKIINFFKNNNTTYCYVHFTFMQSQPGPIIFIDLDEKSYPDMYCVKYTKFL